jgi:hypothetical protein
MASRILNRNFKYRNADTTDVRLTFARIRRQWRKAESRAVVEAPKDGKLLSPSPETKTLGSENG